MLGLFLLSIQSQQIKQRKLRRHQYFQDVHEKTLGLEKKLQADDDIYQYFDQILDHFNNSDTRTFKQRFIVNDTYCPEINTTTPVIIFMGGEGELSTKSLAEYYSVSYFAKELNALQFALEHRYYGKSWPSQNTSDLQYLSSKQAIQDVATFISSIKQFYGLTDTNKVIISGGSYTGFMSEMARSQLSHVIDFSQAASGPNLAIVEFPQYYEHFNKQFQYIAGDVPGCYDNMIQAIQYLINLTHVTNEDGTFNLSQWQDFTGMDSSLIPENLTWKDIGMLEGTIPGDLIGTMQYYKMPGYNGSDYEGDLQMICNDFMNNLAQFNDTTVESCAKAYLQTFPDIITTDFSYQSMIDCLQDIDNSLGCSDTRSWVWQTCTEFGYFQDIDDNLASIYGIYNNISLSYAQCYDGYFSTWYSETDNNTYPITEQLVNEYIDYTNTYYGARNQQRDKVFITGGTVDPWSELQLLENRTWSQDGQYLPNNTEMQTLVNRSHCTDMYLSWTVNDDIRKQQLDDMKQWLELQ